MPLFEIITSVSLIIFALFLLEPTGLLMPKTLEMMVPVAIVVLFFIMSVFIWKERALDEREETHMRGAGRWSFFAGAAVLVCGIVIQAFAHDIDPWLIYALTAMVIVKMLSQIYSKWKS